jgi:hypothetical protein
MSALGRRHSKVGPPQRLLRVVNGDSRQPAADIPYVTSVYVVYAWRWHLDNDKFMKKLTIIEWAAIGEIVATVGVLISIGFLAHGINRNSEILQATNDNLIYELVGAAYGAVYSSPYLAPIRAKLLRGEELDVVERDRYDYFLYQQMDIWELAFDRHSEGLLSDNKWESWNMSFEGDVMGDPFGLSRETWKQNDYYGPDFTRHINEIYSRQ